MKLTHFEQNVCSAKGIINFLFIFFKIWNLNYDYVIVTCLVPVLTIVAEGDIDTIEFVLQVLKQNLPVLILKGSGKAADFIANFICE